MVVGMSLNDGLASPKSHTCRCNDSSHSGSPAEPSGFAAQLGESQQREDGFKDEDEVRSGQISLADLYGQTCAMDMYGTQYYKHAQPISRRALITAKALAGTRTGDGDQALRSKKCTLSLQSELARMFFGFKSRWYTLAAQHRQQASACSADNTWLPCHVAIPAWADKPSALALSDGFGWRANEASQQNGAPMLPEGQGTGGLTAVHGSPVWMYFNPRSIWYRKN